jgi:phosphatidylglycerophosphate synthase
MTQTTALNRRQRLVYFPSLHADEFLLIKAFKFVFELIAKLTLNWWALIIDWFAEKTNFNGLRFLIKQIPNLLSFFRIFFIPCVCANLLYSIYAKDHQTAVTWFKIMVIVISLDAIDGPAARDLDAVTEFGARLDPASDKFCFTMIVLTYCIASLFEYSLAFCLVAFGLALWCLHVERKLISLSIGKFKDLLKVLKYYDPNFSDPGAFWVGKVKFCLQMAACIVGWLGLIWFPADPTAILLMTIILFAARSYGDKSLGMHRQEYITLLVVAIILQNTPKWGRGKDNVIPIRKPA